MRNRLIITYDDGDKMHLVCASRNCKADQKFADECFSFIHAHSIGWTFEKDDKDNDYAICPACSTEVKESVCQNIKD